MCDKVCLTKKNAEAFLHHKRRKQHRREIRCYYCEICGAWHLTSKELIDHTIPVEINLKYKNKWKKILKR